MALSDWYELIDEAFIFNTQRVLNVYHAERASTAFDAGDVALAFFDSVLVHVRALQSAQINHTRILCQNLGDPLDFDELALTGQVGGIPVTSDMLPFFVAPRVQFLRDRTDMRHGWKRIVGITEEHINNNNVGGSYGGFLTTYGQAVVDPWELASNPGVTVAQFGVILRICAEFDAAGVCLNYRLPENDAELQFYKPQQFIARATVGHQTTRIG